NCHAFREVFDLPHLVQGLNPSLCATGRPQHQALGKGTPAGELHAFQQFTIGETSDGDIDVVAINEVIKVEYSGDIEPFGLGNPTAVVMSRPRPGWHVAADTCQGGSCDHGLRSTTDAHEDIDAGVMQRCHQGASHVPIANQANAGTD